MSDSKLNQFVASGTTTERLAFTPSPPTPASGPDPGYTFWDTTLQALYVWNAGTSAWVAAGGGGSGTVTHTAGALTLNELVVGNGSADIKVVAATDGQVPIGKTSDGSVTLATLTQGAGMTVTNGAASITIAASTAERTRTIGITVDGGGSVPATGTYGFRSFTPAGTITAVRLFADQSGSAVMDIWKAPYASFPPTVANTITASDKPTLSTAQKYSDTTLTGWTTTVSAGDVFAFHVDSISTITRLSLELDIVVS